MLRFHLRIFYRQIAMLGLISAGAFLLLLPARYSNSFWHNGLLYGDVLYPPLVGWVTAGVIVGDKTAELLLTLPRPLWQIYIYRFFTLLPLAWVIGGCFLGGVHLFSTYPIPFFWLYTAGTILTGLFFAALGGAISSWRSSHLMGGIFLTSVWSIFVLLQEQLLFLPLLNPFLTYQNIQSEVWLLNRLIFGVLALLFFLITLKNFHTVSENLLKNIENIP